MTVEIYEITPLPDDVLYVRGAVDGVAREARGWQSAITNHYDASAYTTDADGYAVRDPAATSRPMTADEARAYCEQLLAPDGAQPPDHAKAAALPAIALDAEPPTPLGVAQASAGAPDAATTEGSVTE